jgi:hypothetical protein
MKFSVLFGNIATTFVSTMVKAFQGSTRRGEEILSSAGWQGSGGGRPV